jgi:hypothetical protein
MSRTISIVSTLVVCSAISCTIDQPTSEPSSTTSATTQASSVEDCPPNMPAGLAPAADADLAFVFDAQGVQRYTCVGATTGFTWTFIAPDADLFAPNPHHQVMHHFAGPTWVYKDSSSVRAAKAAGVTVDATAVPWLLLNVVAHGGDEGRMTDITQIQRLETTGGNAPATGCDADHVGAESDVLYTARYFFYRSSTRPNRTQCGAI